MEIANRNNFMDNTKVLFYGCKMPKRNPDYISPSGSKYWFGENKVGQYVIRASNHWVCVNKKKYKLSIGSCYWMLITLPHYGRFISTGLRNNSLGKWTDQNIRSGWCGKAYFKNFIKITNNRYVVTE